MGQLSCGADQHRDGADREDAARRLQRAARSRTTASSARAQIIRDPATGQPFPSNIIPANRLSANGLALLTAYPLPTPGFQPGTANAIINSDNPQDQRKDNIRVDYRLNANNSFTYRYGKYNWTAVDAFRGTFPFARTDWDRPNTTQTLSWTSTHHATTWSTRRATPTRSTRCSSTCSRATSTSAASTASPIPYIFPENKEIPDKIPTITIANFTEIDGGPYPSSSQGPIHTFSDTPTWVKNRHTFKGGIVFEYSGEDDFDQINVQPIPGSTNNQNGRFQFTNSSTGANRRWPSPTRRWACSRTTPRSASAR